MNKIVSILSLVLLVTLTSCKTTAGFTYFDDLKPGESYDVKPKGELVVQPSDRISIVVTCKQPELSKMFNITIADVASASGAEASSASKGNSYKVDQQGDINFPILGRLHVAGLTLPQVSDMIRNRIIADEYIKDPIVITDILNFKYTVLGSTGPGVYTSEDGEVTLLDAIAKAGDVKDIGRIDKVAVIRENNGKREIYYNNLKSKDIFNSPVYYLQQNDIVYVEPKYRQRTKTERVFSVTSMVSSFVLSISTLLYYFKK